MASTKPSSSRRRAPFSASATSSSKHGNKRTTTADGVVHASKREARRWDELRLLARAGLLANLNRQVAFVLAPSVRLDGEKRTKPALRYVADFVYDEPDGAGGWRRVVEDSKGHRTDAYRIKRHLMATVHGIQIRET